MWCETMTSPERMGAVMRGEKPDRVPVIPFIFGHTALVCGQPLARVFDDAEQSFRCQMLCQEMYGYDGGPLYAYASAGGLGVRRGDRVPLQEVLGRPGGHPASGPDGGGRAGARGARRRQQGGRPSHRSRSRAPAGRARHARDHADRLAVHLGRLGHRRRPHDDVDAQEAGAGASRARQGVGLRHQGGRALRGGVRRREPHRVPRRRHRVQQAHLAQAVRDASCCPTTRRSTSGSSAWASLLLHPHLRRAEQEPPVLAAGAGAASDRSSASAARSRCGRPWRCSRSRSSPGTWTRR